MNHRIDVLSEPVLPVCISVWVHSDTDGVLNVGHNQSLKVGIEPVKCVVQRGVPAALCISTVIVCDTLDALPHTWIMGGEESPDLLNMWLWPSFMPTDVAPQLGKKSLVNVLEVTL